MFRRQVFDALEAHLSDHEVTVITGMRRTGKTTSILHLLSCVSHSNKVFLDLERIEHRQIFRQKSFSKIQADLEFLGIDFSKAGVIALDEVQLVPEVASFVKYYYDHSPIKFILSGSSSYYLKNQITESLAGRKQVFEVFPLNFIEFLRFKEVDEEPLWSQRLQTFRPLVFAKYQHLYEEYLRFGGFPQVVLADSPERKVNILKDILNSYLELDVKILSDYSVIDDLFRLVSVLSSRIGNKLDKQKIGVLLGINRNKINDYIALFEATYFLHLISPYATNPDRHIALQPKVYIADNGLAAQLAQLSSGALFENAIANQLMRLGKVNYFQKKSGQEIDFILDEKTAFEVKETPGQIDLKKTIDRAQELALLEAKVIGRMPPGNDFTDFLWGGCVF